MASQKAKQIDFLSAGLSDSSGQPRRGAKIYFYPSSSKTTPKAVYNDINKSQVLSQPIILGNSGEVQVFGEGPYYIEGYTKDDVLFDTWDGYTYSSSVDFGGLYIDIGADYGTTGTAIQTAIDAVNSNNNYSFLFQNSDFIISQNIVFPDNVVCHLWPTARFTIAAGKDVKFEIDYVKSPGTEFFFGSGSVTHGDKVTENDESDYWGGSHKVGKVVHKNTRWPVSTSADNSSQDRERIYRIDATNGDKTFSLSSATTHQGLLLTVIKTDSSTNTVTINPHSTQKINGALTSYVLYRQFDSVTFLCTGTGWEIVSFHSDRQKEQSAYSIDESFNIKYYNTAGASTGFRAQWYFSGIVNDKKVKLINDVGHFSGKAALTAVKSGSQADLIIVNDMWGDSYGPHNASIKRIYGQNTSNADFYWGSGAEFWAKLTGTNGTYNVHITIEGTGTLNPVESPTWVSV